MAANDMVLLDALVEKSRTRLGTDLPQDDLFELFCLEQILKEHALTYDDLAVGWVDGGHDGGIDGFYTFVDEHLATMDDMPEAHKSQPSVEIFVCTIKHRDSFQQAPHDQLHATLADLLDLSKDDDDLAYPYNESVLEARAVFRQALLDNADKRFRFRARIAYVCRGDTTHIDGNIKARGRAIQELIPKLVRETEACDVIFIGSSQLLDFARRLPDYSIKLPFIESVLSRGKTNYALLCRLYDYFKFISDEDGSLRRYLFESNVRDYLGAKTAVNRDITATLAERIPKRDFIDFWWLNNGVTFLASYASTVGKEIYLENVQIVNGLQTSETMHQWYSTLLADGKESDAIADDRAILIKIVITEDREILDRIIKASNYQSTVDTASLRATDKVQRDIEEYLENRDWYYERRNNYWQNRGKHWDRIVTPRQLAKCVRSVALCDPLGVLSSKSRVFRSDQVYRVVFSDSWSLAVYWAALTIVRTTERIGRTQAIPTPEYQKGHLSLTLPFASYLYVALCLSRPKWGAEEIVSVAENFNESVAKDALGRVSAHLVGYLSHKGPSVRPKQRLRQRGFLEGLLSRCGLGAPSINPVLAEDFNESEDVIPGRIFPRSTGQ